MASHSDQPNSTYPLLIREAPKLLKTIEADLMQLRQNGTAERFQHLFQAVQTLEQQVSRAGIEAIPAIAHRFSLVLQALQQRPIQIDAPFERLLLQAYEGLRLPLTEQIVLGQFDVSQALLSSEPILLQLEARLEQPPSLADSPVTEPLLVPVISGLEMDSGLSLDDLFASVPTDSEEADFFQEKDTDALATVEVPELFGPEFDDALVAGDSRTSENPLDALSNWFSDSNEATSAVEPSAEPWIEVDLSELDESSVPTIPIAPVSEGEADWEQDADAENFLLLSSLFGDDLPQGDATFAQSPDASSVADAESVADTDLMALEPDELPDLVEAAAIALESPEISDLAGGAALDGAQSSWPTNDQFVEQNQDWTAAKGLVEISRDRLLHLNHLLETLANGQVDLVRQRQNLQETTEVLQREVADLQVAIAVSPTETLPSGDIDTQALPPITLEHLKTAVSRVDELSQQVQQTLQLQAQAFSHLRRDLIAAQTLGLRSFLNRFPPLLYRLIPDKLFHVTLDVPPMTLDRAVLEALHDPLLQLLRDCVAESIESLEIRRQKGKPDLGQIELRVQQQGHALLIHIQDDGQGLRPECLSQHVARLRSLHGTLTVDSSVDQRLQVTLRLPSPLMSARLLICLVDAIAVAFSASTVKEIVVPRAEQLNQQDAQRVLHWQGHRVPIYRVATLLQQTLTLPPQPSRSLLSAAQLPESWVSPLLIVMHESHPVALEVEALVTQQDSVIKPSGPELDNVLAPSVTGRSTAIAPQALTHGYAVWEDGTLIPVMDSIALLEQAKTYA